MDYALNRVRVKVLDAQGVPFWIPVRIYMGADLAISEDETSNNDYFVLTVIGVDKNKNVYVLDYLKERLSFNAQLNAILDYGRNKFPYGGEDRRGDCTVSEIPCSGNQEIELVTCNQYPDK